MNNTSQDKPADNQSAALNECDDTLRKAETQMWGLYFLAWGFLCVTICGYLSQENLISDIFHVSAT